jgi:hypothetical protein
VAAHLQGDVAAVPNHGRDLPSVPLAPPRVEPPPPLYERALHAGGRYGATSECLLSRITAREDPVVVELSVGYDADPPAGAGGPGRGGS